MTDVLVSAELVSSAGGTSLYIDDTSVITAYASGDATYSCGTIVGSYIYEDVAVLYSGAVEDVAESHSDALLEAICRDGDCCVTLFYRRCWTSAVDGSAVAGAGRSMAAG